MVLSNDQRRLLLDAARETIRRQLAGDHAPPRACPDSALLEHGGCFVSLHELKTHRLRGCVGRMEATKPLWTAVQHAAAGVLDDPRFRDEPVHAGELPQLEVEISVLSPMRQVASPLDFDPYEEGVYLIHRTRSGCFLPQVARETGWNREQLLSRLCTEKLGLPENAWHDADARLLVFTTLVIGPEPFQPVGDLSISPPL